MLDLDDPSFATRIKRLLARHGVPVDAIELELTESAQVVEHSIGSGYRVIAEGIETEPVREWLRIRDCDFGQGYLFARPLDADALERWLAARSDVTSPRPAART